MLETFQVFISFLLNEIDPDETRKQAKDKEVEISNLNAQIHHLEDMANFHLGPDSIFYGLFKKCFSISQGHYVYEACLFGNASQKQGHASTDLGYDFECINWITEPGLVGRMIALMKLNSKMACSATMDLHAH
jgi:hypothetical protein